MRFVWFAGTVLLAVQYASAGLILTLSRTGVSVDYPVLEVRNEESLPVAHLSLTIGDAGKNFDSAQLLSLSEGIGALLIAPDAVNNALRSDELVWELMGFAEASFQAKLDIDGDSGAATVDWQETLFNNGDLPNSVLTVTWGNGLETRQVLSDEVGRDPMAPYVITVDAVSVPEPAMLLPLFAGGALLKRRRWCQK